MDFQFSSVEIILLSALGLSFLIQMIYYLAYYTKPLRYQKTNENIGETAAKPPVSIIICSRNESQNLSRFLPSVLEQDYPQYEVIVVNDGSTDESERLLSDFEKQYKHLYHTYIPEESKQLSRKKLAIMVGIKASKHDFLLFTEACCEPVTKDWISRMSCHFSENKSVVIGFSPLERSHNLSSKFAAYDNFIDGLKHLSLAISGRPYRGVGRNIAYKKSLFFENKGFSKYMHLQSGEDDLFINQVADQDNTAVELTPNSIIRTHLESFKMWKEIRLCQSTTQHYYKPGPVALWRGEFWSRFLFWASTITSIAYGIPSLFLPITAGLLFITRLAVLLSVINKTSRKLHTERFYYTLPLFDFFQLIFDSYIYICRITRGKKDYI